MGWIGERVEARDFTYSDLSLLTNCFANVLKRSGLTKGERVCLLTGRIPELYVSALGALKAGNVFCPLFSAFGPEPIHQRISIGDGRVLVTASEDLRSDLLGFARKRLGAVVAPKEIDFIANVPKTRHPLRLGTSAVRRLFRMTRLGRFSMR